MMLTRAADYIAAQSIQRKPYALSSAAYAAGAYNDRHAREFAATASNYATEAFSSSRQSFDDMVVACSTDAEELDRRTDPVTLAHQQLWPGRPPEWFAEDWDELKGAMLGDGQHWIVWTDWYEDRLNGRTANQAFEVTRATIPNVMWEQEPALLNAHIQDLLRQHGISRSEIRVERNFSLELEALTQKELAMIGARVALRAIPLLALDIRLRYVLRAISSAWTAARYQLPADHPTHANQIYTDLSNSPNSLDSKIADTLLASASSARQPAVVRDMVEGIEALREATFRKSGEPAEAAFDLCLGRDLNDLRDAPAVAAISELPLWLGEVPPKSAIARWDGLKRELLEAKAGWEVWVDWYEDRVVGLTRSKARELAHVDVPNELWPQGDTNVNAWIKRRIDEVERSIPSTDTTDPSPVIGAPNPLGIVARPDGRIGAEAGPLAAPVLPPSITPEDHKRSLAACRNRAENLRQSAEAPTFQGRREYAEILSEYIIWLPAVPSTGNILLADGEARILHELFAAEEAILPTVFAARLKVLLQDHIALRTFYPELERHYVAVKTGRLTRPLKRDAVEAIKQIIQENTPNVFENSVDAAMDELGNPVPHVEAPRPEDIPPPDDNRPKPPKDPVADIDPQKTRSFIFASGANRIWELLKKGKEASEGLKGLREVYEQMSPHIGAIIEWFSGFLPGGGGGEPPMPPTISV
jgi:hypothetical protein